MKVEPANDVARATSAVTHALMENVVKEPVMTDVIYLGLSLGFFALAILYTRAAGRL